MNYLTIIDSIKKKDQSGLEKLYNNFGAKLYGFARKSWHLTEDEAWDLIYKTLLKIIEVIDRYEFQSEKHFQNWTYKIFKNELLQYLRKSGRRSLKKEILSLESLQGEPSIENNEWEVIIDGIEMINNPSINELLQNDEYSNPAIKALETALDKMDETDKQILLLRAQEFNYDEIASFLGIDKKNLKVKYLRAKQKLLKLFGLNINNKTDEKEYK